MRLYRALLHLLPRGFRGEYGEAMEAVFADRRRRATGAPAVARLWAAAFADVARNAAAGHLDLLAQDLRQARRALGRSPAFTATAVTVIALGIAAATTAFSLLDPVLVRPLPFPDSDGLVKLYGDQTSRGYAQMELSPADFRDWRAAGDGTIASMGAYHTLSANLRSGGEPLRLPGAAVTASLFPTLGLRPAIGRGLRPEDEAPGAPATVLLDHDFWQTRFAGDRGVVGREVVLDDEPHVVVGVMPAAVDFPSRETRFWRPARFAPEDYEDRANYYLHAVARLRPGATLAAARDELGAVAAELARRHPETNAETGAAVLRLRDDVARSSRLLVVALFGASLSVLLVACCNLAGLLLSRGLARRRELALRSLLGARPDRLLRQLLTESLLLAGLGGAVGFLVATVATPLAARLVPEALPIAEPRADLRVLLFTVALTLVTGLAFGIAPALGAGRRATASAALAEGSRAGTGAGAGRLRAALVAAGVALSLVLLVATGLLGRALWRVRAVDPGFDAAQILTLRTWLPRPRYAETERRHEFYSRVLAGVRALPGVDDAAYTSFLPFVMRGGIWPVELDGAPGEEGIAALRFVTPRYFATLGIPLLAGRDVAADDDETAPSVAVVSRSFAERAWPGREPLGRRFTFAFRERTVVGVVGDVRFRGLERTSEPQVYLPARQVDDGWLIFYDPKDLAIKSDRDPADLLRDVRAVIAAVDPSQPVSDVRTLPAIVAEETASRTVQARTLGLFAAITLLLAGVGVYGLLAHLVTTRLPELGVRKALGARPADVAVTVCARAGGPALVGIAAGLALALAAARALESLLAGVGPGDPAVFAVALGALLATTALACAVPAVRAARVDPITAIRRE